jgi:hypothetical protein
VAALADGVPVVLPLPLDRGRQLRGRVARALLLVPREEARVVALLAPADHERVHVALRLLPHVEEARALRRAQPLIVISPRLRGQTGWTSQR